MNCDLEIQVLNVVKKQIFQAPEFKAAVGLEAVREEKSNIEIAQEYGVHLYQVENWKKEILEHAKTLFVRKRGPTPTASLSVRLMPYSEYSKLKFDLDELKEEALHTPVEFRRSWIGKESGISISRQCVLAGVSRATVYAHQKRRREKSLHPPEVAGA